MWVLLSLLACESSLRGYFNVEPTSDSAATETGLRDADQDGVIALTDCDDDDPTIHPGATEVCDEIDQDCDGQIDELAADTTSWFTDSDQDGYGDPASGVLACEAPEGTTDVSGDCDDDEPLVHPAGVEDCLDGLDNDCNGAVDDAAGCQELAINADAAGVDLAVLLGGPKTAVTVTVTVAAGVTRSSGDTGTPALSTGELPAGSVVVLVNEGTIQGHGGDGACEYGGDGGDGGDAIQTWTALVIDNAGHMYGGGGGGGCGDDPAGGGGGAGGGVGCDGGSDSNAGHGGDGSYRFDSRIAGGDPSLYDGTLGLGGSWGVPPSDGTGGSGGQAQYWIQESGEGQGGAGGGWGGGGGGGSGDNAERNPGNGGDAGYAVRTLGAGSVTFTSGHDTDHVKGWVE